MREGDSLLSEHVLLSERVFIERRRVTLFGHRTYINTIVLSETLAMWGAPRDFGKLVFKNTHLFQA